MTRRPFAIAPLIVFPLVGPAAIAFTMAAPLAIVSVFALGPAGPLYYLMLAGWWLPGLYALLAPPFLLSGIFFVIARLFVRTSPLLVAMLATEIAFFAYFAFWHFVPGGVNEIAPDYARINHGFSRSSGSVLAVILGTVVSWYVLRKLKSQAVVEDAQSGRASAALIGAVLAGAAVLAFLPATVPLPPAEAWKDCTEGGYDDRIRGCTDIINRGAEEPIDRRTTALVRRGGAYLDRSWRPEYRQDLARAIADFTEAIRLDPNRADAYVQRGLAHAQQNDDDQTIADLDNAQRLDANLFMKEAHRLFRARGLALFRKGDFERAIADHTDEIHQAPRFADGYLHRAAAHLAKGDVEQAIADFSDAIRIEPYRAAGYVGRGSIYMAQGDLDRALADFDEAIRRFPKLRLTAPAYRKRGEVLEQRGDQQEALAAFEMALSLDPSDRDAMAGRERARAALQR